jgi:hypothetical protein
MLSRGPAISASYGPVPWPHASKEGRTPDMALVLTSTQLPERASSKHVPQNNMRALNDINNTNTYVEQTQDMAQVRLCRLNAHLPLQTHASKVQDI